VSVRLTLEVGPDVVAEFARRCGVNDIPPHPGPSIALGAYEVTLLELAGGYQVFQNGGGRTTPYLIEQVASTGGQVLFFHPTSAPTPVYDPLFATRMVGMMKGVITGGTGTRANLGRPMAGKTGTSQNWRDAWFVGFTPDMLAGVWVGNDDNRSMAHVTGGELPALIWKRFMTVALKNVPPSDFPWLSTEPEPPPESGPAPETPYVDEPPMTGGDDQAGPLPEDQPPGYEDDGPNGDPRYGRDPKARDDGRYREDPYDDGAPPWRGGRDDGRDSRRDGARDQTAPPRHGYYDPSDRYPYDDPPRRPGADDEEDDGSTPDARGGDGREQRLPQRRDPYDPAPPPRYRY
jgi:membrane peptidoglycan carboxypeptidase